MSVWYLLVPAPHLAELFHPRLVDDINVLDWQVFHLLDPHSASGGQEDGVGVLGDIHEVLKTPVWSAINQDVRFTAISA